MAWTWIISKYKVGVKLNVGSSLCLAGFQSIRRVFFLLSIHMFCIVLKMIVCTFGNFREVCLFNKMCQSMQEQFLSSVMFLADVQDLIHVPYKLPMWPRVQTFTSKEGHEGIEPCFPWLTCTSDLKLATPMSTLLELVDLKIASPKSVLLGLLGLVSVYCELQCVQSCWLTWLELCAAVSAVLIGSWFG